MPLHFVPLSDFVRHQRVSRGWSQRDLASIAGLNATTISRIETGTIGASRHTVYRLAEALEVDPDMLLFRPNPPAPARSRPELNDLRDVSKDLISELRSDPDLLHKISPRKFEEVVAELLFDMGCDVELTPETRDGGRDILAGFNSPVGRLLAIVECKRYSRHRPIGTSLVERFLWTVEQRDRASIGIFATTSSFTAGARERAKDRHWTVKLKEHRDLREWLNNYGHWQRAADTEIWTPVDERFE